MFGNQFPLTGVHLRRGIITVLRIIFSMFLNQSKREAVINTTAHAWSFPDGRIHESQLSNTVVWSRKRRVGDILWIIKAYFISDYSQWSKTAVVSFRAYSKTISRSKKSFKKIKKKHNTSWNVSFSIHACTVYVCYFMYWFGCKSFQ